MKLQAATSSILKLVLVLVSGVLRVVFYADIFTTVFEAKTKTWLLLRFNDLTLFGTLKLIFLKFLVIETLNKKLAQI